MYVLLVDALDEQVRTDQIVAAVARSAGNDVEMPSVVDARKSFDEWLISEVTPEQREIDERLILLGLR